MDYHNMPIGSSKLNFILRHHYNSMRTWWLFHVRFPWIKYHGFVRVMKQTSFAHNIDVQIGDNVQFGIGCKVACNVHFGNNVLMAGDVQFVGSQDHTFNVPGQTIWNGKRGENGTTTICDDVWIGARCVIMSGITVGAGSVIAAGAVVTKDVPPCEVWGGVPAKKIKDRFASKEDKEKHLQFLKDKCQH